MKSQRRKRCRKCDSIKDLSRFPKKPTGYVYPWCKDCYNRGRRIRWKEYKAKNLEKVRTRQRLFARKARRENPIKKLNEYLMYWKNNPEKVKAHQKVRYALQKGKLVKSPCKVCRSRDRVHAHHSDYSKPLEVIWLCPVHHKAIHSEKKVAQIYHLG